MRLSRWLLSLVLLAGCSIDTEGSLEDTPTGLGGQAGTGGQGGKAGRGGHNEGGAFPVGGKAGAGMSGTSGEGGAGAGQGGAGNEPGGAGNAGNEPGGAGAGGAGMNQGGAGMGGAGNEPGGAGAGGAGTNQGGAGNEPGGAGAGGAGTNQGGAGNEPGGAGMGGAGAGQGGAGMGGAGKGGDSGASGSGGMGTIEPLLKTAVVWLDANDIAATTVAVTSWPNKGTYPAATTSTTGQGPTFSLLEAGFPHPSVHFSPAQQLALIIPADDLKLQAATTFAVTRIKTSPPPFFALTSKHGSAIEPQNLWGTFFYGPGSLGYIGYSTDYVAQVAVSPGSWFIYQASSEPGAGTLNLSVDGVSASKSSKFEDIGGDFVVGAYRTSLAASSLSGFLDGDLAEVLVFDHVLDAGQQSDIQGYLKKKWGL